MNNFIGANEDPDADTNAPDFENKVSDCAAAFSPSWEKDLVDR